MVPLSQNLIEVGWPQLPSPVQTNNTTAAGVVNNTVVRNKMKTMVARFHCLCYRERQIQLRFYLNTGSRNWVYYRTKHHRPAYHEAHLTTYAVGSQMGYHFHFIFEHFVHYFLQNFTLF